ncbi:hypothetical protein Veis_3962 [Verminephrobacter eiseniae EF01-2]|uniref:Uncharacterized protein n=1 Tax=Verminephrobacter eiseniae (strain EF01-2) TaxID=391735 RepID=A1WPW2_VEREI|nr:hypothetical protein Veis_3962 [Verminephrobacter eiseniae EF01-2]
MRLAHAKRVRKSQFRARCRQCTASRSREHRRFPFGLRILRILRIGAVPLAHGCWRAQGSSPRAARMHVKHAGAGVILASRAMTTRSERLRMGDKAILHYRSTSF